MSGALWRVDVSCPQALSCANEHRARPATNAHQHALQSDKQCPSALAVASRLLADQDVPLVGRWGGSKSESIKDCTKLEEGASADEAALMQMLHVGWPARKLGGLSRNGCASTVRAFIAPRPLPRHEAARCWSPSSSEMPDTGSTAPPLPSATRGLAVWKRMHVGQIQGAFESSQTSGQWAWG
eukprot:7844478-Alexandrium_andersonii.AAC.1